jgi:hypothetical protein
MIVVVVITTAPNAYTTGKEQRCGRHTGQRGQKKS